MPIQDNEAWLSREWSLLPTLPVLGVACGILLGAVTNAINGWVSPYYFRRVMNWSAGGQQLWAAAIGQGAIEGALLGFGFGIAFGVIVVATTGLRCLIPAVARSFFFAIVTILICWTVGGVIGLVTATWQPWLVWTVGLQPSSRAQEIAVGWVGGTVYGAYAGTLIAVVVASVTNRRCAKTFSRAGAFPVLQADSSRRGDDDAPLHV